MLNRDSNSRTRKLKNTLSILRSLQMNIIMISNAQICRMFSYDPTVCSKCETSINCYDCILKLKNSNIANTVCT